MMVSPWFITKVVDPLRRPQRGGRRNKFAFALLTLLVLMSAGPVRAAEPVVDPSATAKRSFLPFAGWRAGSPSSTSVCPISSSRTYGLVPVIPPPSDRPAAQHADLNLAMRGWAPTTASLGLVDYSGHVDAGAPQLADLFAARRSPSFAAAFRVYDWDWGCGTAGCRGAPLTTPAVTLVRLNAVNGEAITPPARSAEIYAGGYLALVLYASEQSVTLKYTREDNVISGYTVHLDGICVDPSLRRSYEDANAAGRASLPGLKAGDVLGTAATTGVIVAVRDCGSFLDPRSRKDWWHGF